jgi:hypothetical protein
VTFGPFALPDPTAPTWPSVCAAVGAPGYLSAHVATPASDLETGILGYQYRVIDGTTVLRDWPSDSTDWSRLASGETAPTAQLPLVEGHAYTMEIRALNGHRQAGRVVASGPLTYDVSAPAAPTVSASMVDATTLRLLIVAPADPHSGLAAQQMAVGTTQDASDLLSWRPVPGAGVGSYEVRVPLGTQPATGATWWVQLRTVNGVGLPSAITRGSFVRYVPPMGTRR